ncbi:LON peptidase substrate-binding domain-containing protein [Methylocella sp.]|uniref:LON peptidase substrate-binding domain-containing protein n=1 Tax=Methylocella sp. TaxID=1978226 RepID=UPI003785278F
MSSNRVYEGAQDMPAALPLFPLVKALLLPRGELPLNVFEPRYLAMIDDALKGERLIGMIQPDLEKGDALFHVGCAGRLTQFAETGDGRYLVTLTGVARFRLLRELDAGTPYRQAEVDYAPFGVDFIARAGEDLVDREGLLSTLRSFASTNGLQLDWDSIDEAPNEALVNALSMMSPFGVREKQALLEAADLKGRADVLVAITEIELARGGEAKTTLQ